MALLCKFNKIVTEHAVADIKQRQKVVVRAYAGENHPAAEA